MPEGHTIHALAARLDRAFAGAPVQASSPQGRFAVEAARLDGRLLMRSRAAGKHLFVEFADSLMLHVHLGLIGQFPVRPRSGTEAPPVVGAVRLRLSNGTHDADLRGPMICALVDPERHDAIVGSLGPDPLDPMADGDHAWRRIQTSASSIAELLMNQTHVAGVGNVYRCEVLYRNRIDPFVAGRELSRGAWGLLWNDLVGLLPLGVSFSQILTMDDQVAEARRLVADGTAAAHAATLTGERLGDWFERRFHVYQRVGEPCHRCAGTVAERIVAGRRLYWCPGCQTTR